MLDGPWSLVKLQVTKVDSGATRSSGSGGGQNVSGEFFLLMFFLRCCRCCKYRPYWKRCFPPNSVLTAHFGDHDSSIHPPGYLSDSQFIPDQNDDFLTKVESLHEQHRWEEGQVAYFGNSGWALSDLLSSCVWCRLLLLLLMNPLSRCRGFVNLWALMMADIFGITSLSVKREIRWESRMIDYVPFQDIIEIC